MIFPNRFYLGFREPVNQVWISYQMKLWNLVILILPVVALNDVYFLTNEDGWMQDMLHCIQTGREIDIDDQNNSKLSQHYLKSDEEMIELFKDVPDAISNTVKIANECDLELITDQVLLPRFECRINCHQRRI